MASTSSTTTINCNYHVIHHLIIISHHLLHHPTSTASTASELGTLLAQHPVGWWLAGVLALALLGIALMPASGFWLVLPPALALCWGPGRRTLTA